MPEPEHSHQDRTVHMPLLSACLVVHNEEAIVERCLRSLAGLDGEILVIHDGPCTDRTLDIARRYTRHVFVRPFVGHAEGHRVFAYQHARGEWLLAIDADEFLSPQMAAALPELMARSEVSAYEFVWPLWDGRRPLTSGGPLRLALMRRSAIELVGAIQNGPEVHGRVEARPEILHHQPTYNNFTWKTAMTKQRRWARLHGHELTRPLSQFPMFNYSGPAHWPPHRRMLNHLSPVLAFPYGGATFLRTLRNSVWKPSRPALRVRLRVSFYMGVYRTMVQLYVARRLYLEPVLTGLHRLRGATGKRSTVGGPNR
jgi:glycosyltransferase involved in cell wall biosynthesis